MIWHIARREWLEQVRHPGILLIGGGLIGAVTLLTVVNVALLDLLARPPYRSNLEQFLLESPDRFLEFAVVGTLASFNFLAYSQYIGFVGVIAGHALLHDRQVGTLPFLLLAPVPRLQLLAGKVLGALGPLTAIVVVVMAVAGLVVGSFPSVKGHEALAARTVSWWVALLGAGPSWGAFVATVAVVLSSVARDVRFAQQAVWLVVFVVQLVVAFLITGSLNSLEAQLGATLLGAVLTGGALWVGVGVLAWDRGR